MTKRETKKIEDVEAFRIALALCGIAADTHSCELIIEVYEGFMKKGESFSIADVSKIKASLYIKHSKVSVTAVENPNKTNKP